MSSAAGGASSAARGLEGIVVAETVLSDVDGNAGQLTIRGYALEEIAGRISYEEACHLMWYGHLPTRQELDALTRKMVAARRLPEAVRTAVELGGKAMEPMDALRFAAAGLSADDPAPDDASEAANLERAIRITARIPVIVANYDRVRRGEAMIEPRDDLGHTANFLYMRQGEPADPHIVHAAETYFVTVIDHGMNASTFTARVIASTASDMVSAITGAIGALKGPLHGGAPGPALEMIEAIGTLENAEPWIRAALRRGERLMGFGHRVYKVRDPRAEVLGKEAEDLVARTGDRRLFDLTRQVEPIAERVLAEEKPGRNLHANVELYTALLLQGIGLPEDLFSSAFAIGRVGGWTAHVLEQQAHNRLIRPQSVYIGPRGLRWRPIDQRQPAA